MEELKKEMDVIQTGGGPEKEQPAFECRKLTMRYGKTLALDAVDLTLMPGRIVGLLGPNGSGKTTMIKLANGLLQPTSGEILIAGFPAALHECDAASGFLQRLLCRFRSRESGKAA